LGLLILLVMIGVPIIEICVFIQAGQQIGLWSTIGLVIITALVGSTLLRHQGLSALFNARKSINAGIVPVNELFDGICLLLAGAFLITPGFVTDGFGLMLFLPFFRNTIRSLVKKRLKNRDVSGLSGHPSSKQQTDRNQSPNIIDGEFYEVKTDIDNNSKKINDRNPLLPPQS
jgi:UPF0716 protein FxsA